MIHEYAVEPEVISTWTEDIHGLLYSECFGKHNGRLFSHYPKWKRQVMNAFSNKENNRTNLSEDWELRKGKLIAILDLIAESGAMFKRKNLPWNSALSWIDNVNQENSRMPYHGILTEKNHDQPINIVPFQTIMKTPCNPLWKLERAKRIPRKPSEMTEAASFILCHGQKIHFIEPYFSPDEERFRAPYKAFFREIIRYRSKPYNVQIMVHLSDKLGKKYFDSQCEKKIPKIVPEGLIIEFKRWLDIEDRVKLHDRFILTDIAGIEFSYGLDQSDVDDDTTRVSLLQESEYKEIWEQYTGSKSTLVPEEGDPLEITCYGRQKK